MLIEKAGVFMATGGRECDGLHGEAGEQPFPPPEACTRTEHDRLGACSDPNLDYRYFTEQAHREGTVVRDVYQVPPSHRPGRDVQLVVKCVAQGP